MAVVGNWYPRRLLSTSSPPGRPNPTLSLSGRPIFVPETGLYYCVWVKSSQVAICPLNSAQILYSTAWGYSLSTSGAFYSGGYIWILARNGSTNALEVRQINVSTWAATVVSSFTGYGLGIYSCYSSMVFDGTDMYVIIYMFYPAAWSIQTFKVTTAGVTTNLGSATPSNTVFGVKAESVAASNFYFRYYHDVFGLMIWDPFYVPIAGGSFGAQSGTIFFGNPAYHSISGSVYNADESLSWNIAGTLVLAVINDATPKFITVNLNNFYLYDGATLKATVAGAVNFFTYEALMGQLLIRPDAKEHQAKGLCWMRGGVWYELQPLGREIT